MSSRRLNLLTCLAASAVTSLGGCEPTVEPVVPAATAAPTPAPTDVAEAAPAAPTAGLVKAEAVYDAVKPNLNVVEAGTTGCPAYKQEVLREPTRIRPIARPNAPLPGGVVGTDLIVAIKSRCVPVWTPAPTPTPANPGAWSNVMMNLRTYGFPRDPTVAIKVPSLPTAAINLDDPAIVWSAPGPTFELRKGTRDRKTPGTKFAMTLINAMPSVDANGNQLDSHKCDTMGKLPQKDGTGAQGPFPPYPASPPGPPAPQPPNCFHGDNSTNFHMHGFHVSPQEHQDYVGLEILPWGATGTHHATHGSHGLTRVGQYDYDVDPILYDQAEGTHWYHAHKHGATALQVLNGLTGAFIIRGEFDDKLEEYFERSGGGKIEEHLLVVQQVKERQPALNGGEPPDAELVNGQGNPILQMRHGEIQRWRFVGATQNNGATITVHLPKGFAYAQIAQDGVQFSPENYFCQPLLQTPADGSAPPSCKPVPSSQPSSLKTTTAGTAILTLGPGARVDLLVQAPLKVLKGTKEGDLLRAHYDAPPLDPTRRAPVAGKKAPDPIGGDLFTVKIVGTPVAMKFPTMAEYPAMPAFLADIPKPATQPRPVRYQLKGQGKIGETNFAIDGLKYNPECANETMTLGIAEDWELTNDSGIAHPFHIHTNPFQVVSLQTWIGKLDEKGNPGAPWKSAPTTYQYPIWRDTIPIPKAGGPGQLGEALIRYLPQNFTGGFVNHCHILGHEDRGMMQNVQVVCPGGDPKDPSTWRYGMPSATVPECTGETSKASPLPVCAPAEGTK